MASASAIAAWLTEGRGVSAPWIALSVGCDVDSAHESMVKYLEENKDDVQSKYVLSGEKKKEQTEEGGEKESNEKKDCGNNHLFMIVDSIEMEEMKSKFEGGTCSSHLYSLHTSISSSSNQQLALARLQQTSDYLGSEARTNLFVNAMSLKPRDLEVKAVGKRIKASVASYTLESMKGPSYVSNGNTSGSCGGSSAKLKVARETSVSNFFAKNDKANEKTATTKAASGSGKVTSTSPKKSSPKSSKKNITNSPDKKHSSIEEKSSKEANDALADDEEEEFDTDYKTDRRNLKKRSKVIQDDEEDDSNRGVELTKEDEKLIAKQTGISGGVKFGAMDNFVSEGAQSSEVTGLKRKKKKLVEKVTMDDKGYMVTEMVTEEVTDDEPSPKKPSPKKSIVKPKPEPAVTKKDSTDGSIVKKPQQKGLMSFFGKK